MHNNFDKFNLKLEELSEQAELDLFDIYKKVDEVADYNQKKVLFAMQKHRLSDTHFSYASGYGYNDIGRDTLELIYADVFGAEDALVRPQIVSGTHALTLALAGNLKYGDELIYISGTPYDTLLGVIGVRETKGSLIDNGITYKEVGLVNDCDFDYNKIKETVTAKTTMVAIQRSKGYSTRKTFSVDEIVKVTTFVKSLNPNIIVMVDNCYGEFVEKYEPSDYNIDLTVGSLIKNAGGGLAPVGGYIVGKKDYIENSAIRLTSPGLGKEVGPSLGITQTLMQGFFLAPTVTRNALKTAIFSSYIFEKLGYNPTPKYTDSRHDIVQAIIFDNPDLLISFCRGIQYSSPVDSFVTPTPWDMPGYDNQVIMAAGAFVQGSSIELSADAPIRPPYVAYMQGGLTYEHGKFGVMYAVQEMINSKQINI